MDFDGFTMYGESKPSKNSKIPERYQEFIPGNQDKTKADYPYSYDPFFIYFNEKAKGKDAGCVYTDRLKQWDWDKYQRLCEKHFGNKSDYWHDRPADKIQAFLCDYLDKEIVLVANIQYVNLGNGYPLWRLDFYAK
jgi:hypothetical protein